MRAGSRSNRRDAEGRRGRREGAGAVRPNVPIAPGPRIVLGALGVPSASRR